MQVNVIPVSSGLSEKVCLGSEEFCQSAVTFFASEWHASHSQKPDELGVRTSVLLPLRALLRPRFLLPRHLWEGRSTVSDRQNSGMLLTVGTMGKREPLEREENVNGMLLAPAFIPQ